MAVRAKFVCNEKALVKRGYAGGSEETASVKMHPVYSSDEGSVNRGFWKSTPNGSIALDVLNPAAADQFIPGREYLVTFELVPLPEPAPAS